MARKANAAPPKAQATVNRIVRALQVHSVPLRRKILAAVDSALALDEPDALLFPPRAEAPSNPAGVHPIDGGAA